MQSAIKWHQTRYYSWVSKADAKMLLQISSINFS